MDISDKNEIRGKIRMVDEQCATCKKRERETFDGVWLCQDGNQWPRIGVCRYFVKGDKYGG